MVDERRFEDATRIAGLGDALAESAGSSVANDGAQLDNVIDQFGRGYTESGRRLTGGEPQPHCSRSCVVGHYASGQVWTGHHQVLTEPDHVDATVRQDPHRSSGGYRLPDHGAREVGDALAVHSGSLPATFVQWAAPSPRVAP